MDVVVLGGHGQVARRLLALLAARGDRARGIVRDPGHVADLEAVGAEALVGDVEREDITPLVAGADAVVMAAGAGPGSGRVEAAARLGRSGSITRDDTAAVLVAVLDTPTTIGRTFEVLEGETPIAEAIAAL